MKFTKLAKSDKFEYMMLSRLIQNAKYFIDYPDLKHLWARTLDEHIKQMKEQYDKLDPKPEWISEDEINDLAKQMKESYINHWNKVHPDNKIEAAIQQPNKPKPTTTLPDNMQWAWDPNAADWVAVLKDNSVTTPPLYDPNNQNLVNQNTTSYMSNIKSELRDNGNISDYLALDDGTGTIILVNDKNENFEILLKHRDLDNKVIIKELINKDDLLNGISKVDFTKKYNTFKSDLDKVNISIDDLKHYSDQVNKDLKETLLNKKQSSCLEKFLDNPQYSKEIKIEAGLIKEGLVKYAGFDFDRGTKYVITDKGLKFLKAYKEQELNEAQNEREKLAYLFGFNTDEVSTLDTTGKIIKNSKKWTICEADGTELGEVTADSELDAKVKFGIEHPEYVDSLSICAKEIDAKYEETTNTKEPYPNPSETPHDDIILENHDGWVNTAGLKNKSVYRKLFILAKMLEDYHKKELIWPAESEDDNIEIITGDAKAINELEHKIKDLGFYCESVLQSELPETGLIYSLKIFLDEE